MKFLTNFIANRAIKIASSRDPDFIVGNPTDPYMFRWWAIPRNKYFNIYIHEFHKDDEDRALHDHPWPSLSFMVSGSIIELYEPKDGLFDDFGQPIILSRFLRKGDWVWRPASFAHRLELFYSIQKPLTIFITGPRIRQWGFHCPNGWRHWKDFVNLGSIGLSGRGCAEYDDHDEFSMPNRFHCKSCGESDLKIFNTHRGLCWRCARKQSRWKKFKSFITQKT